MDPRATAVSPGGPPRPRPGSRFFANPAEQAAYQTAFEMEGVPGLRAMGYPEGSYEEPENADRVLLSKFLIPPEGMTEAQNSRARMLQDALNSEGVRKDPKLGSRWQQWYRANRDSPFYAQDFPVGREGINMASGVVGGLAANAVLPGAKGLLGGLATSAAKGAGGYAAGSYGSDAMQGNPAMPPGPHDVNVRFPGAEDYNAWGHIFTSPRSVPGAAMAGMNVLTGVIQHALGDDGEFQRGYRQRPRSFSGRALDSLFRAGDAAASNLHNQAAHDIESLTPVLDLPAGASPENLQRAYERLRNRTYGAYPKPGQELLAGLGTPDYLNTPALGRASEYAISALDPTPFGAITGSLIEKGFRAGLRPGALAKNLGADFAGDSAVNAGIEYAMSGGSGWGDPASWQKFATEPYQPPGEAEARALADQRKMAKRDSALAASSGMPTIPEARRAAVAAYRGPADPNTGMVPGAFDWLLYGEPQPIPGGLDRLREYARRNPTR
jgi:hypothetical protein